MSLVAFTSPDGKPFYVDPESIISVYKSIDTGFTVIHFGNSGALVSQNVGSVVTVLSSFGVKIEQPWREDMDLKDRMGPVDFGAEPK